MKALVFTFLMLGISINLYARTEFSQVVNYVQKKYADQFSDYPILIFDLDELELRYAAAGAFGDSKEKEKERVAIIQDYVYEKVGVELTFNEATTYETYTFALKTGAYAMPTLKDGPNHTKVYKMCAVFPATPNSNQRLEMERLTGLKTPGAYEDTTYTGLQEKLTYEQLKLFSLYHELGHCMDRYFMPENYNTYEVSPHDVHQSESYAEVFALMLLEREGFKGTARTRALMRNLYAQKMGKWFIDNPQHGFGNKLYLKGGVIYYLSPVLLAGGEFVKRKRDFVQNDVQLLLDKARELVDDHSLSQRGFHAVYRGLSEEPEEVIEMYRDFAVDTPSFFADAYEELLKFLDFSPYLLTLMDGNTPDDNSGAELSEVTKEELCSYTSDGLFTFLDELRTELNTDGHSYDSQVTRQKQLNGLFENYSQWCKLN